MTMNPEPVPERSEALQRTYNNLIDLWTSGVRDFHSLLSTYLTANSIFVAAIVVLLFRQPVVLLFTLVVLILCILGILIALQMAVVLGRFDAQNALWEWKLRGMERNPDWHGPKLFLDLYRFRNQKETLQDERNVPPTFRPRWIVRQHRQWWARRAVSFPLFFGLVYGLLLLWGLAQLFV